MKKILRTANAVNGILVMTSGVVLLTSISGCEEAVAANRAEKGKTSAPTEAHHKLKDDTCPLIAMATIGFYTIVFGFLLTAFELRWGEKYRDSLHKYFGFLFGYFGRMMYLLFLATLCLALPADIHNVWVGYTIGSVTLANGLFNCYVIYYHPDISAARKGKKAPKRQAEMTPPAAASSPRSDSTDRFSNPYAGKDANSGGGGGRTARGTMQADEHPAYGGGAAGGAYGAPTHAHADPPAPAYGGESAGGHDDDNPFADPSVNAAF